MPVKLTTPGTYVQEVSTLPPSVAEVETAIPVFIGYTEKADKQIASDGQLRRIPTKINSLSEYEHYFGRSFKELDANITISVKEPTSIDANYHVDIAIDQTAISKHNMYYAMRHFYDNGGGTCYVISVDTYATAAGSLDADEIVKAIAWAADVDEITLLAVPEAGGTLGAAAGYTKIMQALITQAATLKDRFALIDPYQVTPKDKTNPGGKIDDDVAIIRGVSEGPDSDRYAAAYYPNLITAYNYNFGYDAASDTYKLDGLIVENYTDALGTVTHSEVIGDAGGKVKYGSVAYNQIKAAFLKQYVTLPPSPAMAGIYTRVDNNKGVWKAPANETVTSVISPSIPMSDRDQSSLNIDPVSGKSINVIRTFPGYGTLVWGARTLNGNDNEWRYISVRRFFNMVEESVKKSIQWAVFEPNTAGTWIKVQAMIENYLFLKWRDGALAGAKPEQAFYVRLGLGSTMTSLDVLEGRMNVEIGMAVARPAEFIVLTFTQLLQQS